MSGTLSTRRLLLALLAAFALAGGAMAGDVRSDLVAFPNDTIWSNNPNIPNDVDTGGSANEYLNKLFDANTGSKWYVGIPATAPGNSGLEPRVWAVYQFANGAAYTIGSYDWMTGNDASERDPVSWRLCGSNDGRTWAVVDTKLNQAVTAARGAAVTVAAVDAPGCYAMYRFEVLKVREWRLNGTENNWGDGGMQMGELRLRDISGSTAVTTPTIPIDATYSSLTLSPIAGTTQFNAAISNVTPSSNGGALSYEWHVVDGSGNELASSLFQGDLGVGNITTNPNVVVTAPTAGTYYSWVLVRSTAAAGNVTGIRYPPLASLTRGKTITTSLAATGREATFAVDGDLKTRWSPGNDADNHWIEVDLGTETLVDRVTVQYHRDYYARRFQILGRRNGSDWVTMADRMGTYEPGHDLCPGRGLTAATVRYLRVRTIYRNTGGTSIAELIATTPGKPLVIAGPAVGQPAVASQNALNFSTDTHNGIVVPDVAADVFANGLTVSAWINATTIGQNRRIFYLGNTTAGDGSLGIDDISFQFSATTLQALVRDHAGTTTIANVVAPAPLPTTPNRWNHVAMTVSPRNGQPVALILNGVEVATAPLTGDLPVFARACRIGSNKVGTDCFRGEMRNIRVWNRVLSATEIANTMVTPLQGNEPNLVAWYRCEPRIPGDMTLANNADSTAMGAGILQSTSILDNAVRTVAVDGSGYPFAGIQLADRDSVSTSYIYNGTITLGSNLGTLSSDSGVGLTRVLGSNTVYTITSDTGVVSADYRDYFQTLLAGIRFTPSPSLITAMQTGETRSTNVVLEFTDSQAGPTRKSIATARLQVTKTGAGTGLTANWWKNNSFTDDPVLTTLVNSFNAVPLFPSALGTTDNISLRMTGTFVPNFTGAYKVMVNADDGVRVWINGVALIDRWWYDANDTYSGVFNVVSGVPMAIRVDYNQGGGGYKLVVRLQRQSDSAMVDFGSTLYPTAFGGPDQPVFCSLGAVNFIGGESETGRREGLSCIRLPEFRTTAPLTVEAWVQNRMQASNRGAFFYGANIDNNFWMLRTGGTDNRYASIILGANGAAESTALTEQWTHLAGVFRATGSPRFTLYRNGTPVTSSDLGLAANAVTPPLNGEETLFGFAGYQGLPFRGSMKDIRLWSVERSQEQISGSMTSTLVGNEPGLLAWYRRSADYGRTLTDQASRLGSAALENGANIEIPTVATTGTVQPFAKAELLDPDTAASVTASRLYRVIIAQDRQDLGSLSGHGALRALGPSGMAPYELQVFGLAETQAALRALVFTPSGTGTGYVNFTLIFNDGSAADTSDALCAVQIVDLAGGTGNQPPFVSIPAVRLGSGQRNTDIPYGDFVQLPTVPLNSDATVELWARADGFQGNWSRMLTINNRRDSDDDSLQLAFEGTTNLLRYRTFCWGTSCASSGEVERCAVPFPVDQWTHVALTMKAGTATMYFNGQPVQSYAMRLAMRSYDRAIAYLGRAHDSNKYFQGWMKDVRLWSVARSPEQVRGFMTVPVPYDTQGLIGYYQTVQVGLDGQVLYDRSTASPMGSAQMRSNARFTGFSRVYKDQVAQPFAELELVDPDDTDGAILYSATITMRNNTNLAIDNTLGTLSAATAGPATLANLQAQLRAITFTPNAGAADGAVANLQVQITQQGQVVSSVGMAACKILNRPGGVVDQPPFVSLSALRLPSNGDHVVLPGTAGGPLDDNQAVTLEAWVKSYWPWDGYWQRFVHLGTAGTGTNTCFYMGERSNTGYLMADAYIANNRVGALVSESVIPVNGWTHWATVFQRTPGSTNPTGIIIYRNGDQIITTGPLADTAFPADTAANYIGRSGGTDYFRGEVRDVRIWNIARTQAQIRGALTARNLDTGSAGLLAWYPLLGTTDDAAPNAGLAGNGTLSGNAGFTGALPNVNVNQRFRPFATVELVDPDSDPAVAANTAYTVTITPSSGNVTVFNAPGGPITGLTEVQARLRSLECAGTVAGTYSIELAVADRVGGDVANGGAGYGIVTVTVEAGVVVDQPTFCSLSALKLDGTLGIDQHVLLPTLTGTNPPMTIEAWVKVPGPTLGGIWDICSASGQNVLLRMVGNDPYRVSWLSRVSPGGDGTAQVPVTLNTWQHLAAVYAATGNETVYVNGIEAYRRTPAGTMPANVDRTLARFGRDNDGNFSYLRYMKDLRVWSVVRQPNQIRSTMSLPLAGTEAGLVAWYRCYETDGATLANASIANGAIGTATVIGGPDFTGAAMGAVGQVTYPFATAELVDPDTALTRSETANYTITVTILAGGTGAGVLPGGQQSVVNAVGISAAQAALRAIPFTPTAAGRVPFRITVADNLSGSATINQAACYVRPDQPIFCNLPTLRFTTLDRTSVSTGDYVKLPNIDVYGNATLEAWIKVADPLANWQRFFDCGTARDTDASNVIVALNGTSGRLTANFRNPGTNSGNKDVYDRFVFPQEAWTHVAAVYSTEADPQGRAIRLYRNGQLTGRTVLPIPNADWLPPAATRAQSNLGRSNWGGDRYFRGEMKDIRVWSIARTQADIQSTLTTPIARNATGLVGYFPGAYFDSTPGQDVLLSDNTIAQTLQNVCTNGFPAGNPALGNATLMNSMTMNCGQTVSGPTRVFAAADFFDPDTSAALTDGYTYTARITVNSDTNGVSGSTAGTLSGTGLTRYNASTYDLSVMGLTNFVDRMRSLVFTPAPQATTAHVWFELAITDGHARHSDNSLAAVHGRVDITMITGTTTLPPVPTVAPYLTGLNNAPAVATVGWTLVCNPGTWSDQYNPGQAAVTSFTYQWYRVINTNGVITMAAIDGETAQNHVVTNDDMGDAPTYLAVPPIKSLICRVTATSSVTGLTATAWSNALQVNKFGVVETLDTLSLDAVENADHRSLTLTLTGLTNVTENGVPIAANTLAFEWVVMQPNPVYASGYPRFTATWTGIPDYATAPTATVQLDRTGSYRFKVRIYARKNLVAGAISAEGQFTQFYEMADVITVVPQPNSFAISPTATPAPQGGRVDFGVTFRDQFSNSFVLGTNQTIRWTIEAVYPAWTATTAVAQGQFRLPTAGDETGLYYEATTGGVTGGAEPTWPTTPHDPLDENDHIGPSNTVLDGDAFAGTQVAWTCRQVGELSEVQAGNPFSQQLNITGYAVAGMSAVVKAQWWNVGENRPKFPAVYPNWAATTAMAQGAFRLPLADSEGRYYEATTAGVTGGAEPVWPTTVGATVTDGTVVWTCRGMYATANVTIVTGKVWKINFQPASAPVIDAKWYTDTGRPFGGRGIYDANGEYRWGWVQGPDGGVQIDMTTATRDRNDLRASSPSKTILQFGDYADDPATIRQLYDTCIFTQRRAASDQAQVVYGQASAYETINARWEIAVPNGTYQVQLICGDPAYTNSVYSFIVQDVPCVDVLRPTGIPVADGFDGNWILPTPGAVTVTNGRLHIREGVGAVNNKLCGVVIQQLTVAN